MENEGNTAFEAERQEVEALAENIVSEYAEEPKEAIFTLMDELKKEDPEGEVASLMGDWPRKKRLLLQDAIFWKLSQELQQEYVEHSK